MNDEGFREIQLNGKQLVFLFMAATVASVVIFLCGVLVGRGVRDGSQTAAITAAEVGTDPSSLDTSANSAASDAGSRVAATSTHGGDAAMPAEELSYAERLLRDGPPEEHLRPAGSPPPQAPAVQEPLASPAPVAQAAPPPGPAVSAVPAPRSAAPAPTAEVAAIAADPSGPGFAVQVAAYRDRREADNLAKQLIAKGYPAFVMEPVKGAPAALFRVRVGKYKTLKDAEAVSARLQSAEQFNTAWIAR